MSEQHDEEKFRLIDQLIDRLLEAPSHPGEIHVCPICGGCLHVEFAPYMRESKAMLGIHVTCESCGIEGVIEAVRPPLEWLEKPTLDQVIA